MTDAPEGPDALRGGMERGDPGLEGATETGGSGAAQAETGDEAGSPGDNQLSGGQGSDK